MDQEEAGRIFVKGFMGAARANAREELKRVRSGEGIKSPFREDPIDTAGSKLHPFLKKSGLLDDPAFCEAFGRFATHLAYDVMGSMLTFHDGNWMLEEDIEYKIHVKGGDPLPNWLHEMESREFRDAPDW